MKYFALCIAVAAAALPPSVALAQAKPANVAAPALTVGSIVYDPHGDEVGKIVSTAADTVILDTGTNKATLPRSSFGTSAKGPTISATKTQLDALVAAAAAKANAAIAASLVPGTQVYGKAGTVVGTIKQVDGDQVIVDRTAGGSVSLGKSAFAAGPSGVTISMTAAELDAAAKNAAS